MPPAAASHQRRGYRRITASTPAPPAPASAASITVCLTRSSAHPPHDCVIKPTAIALLRDTAATGKGITDNPTTSPAPASAPPATGWISGARRARGGRRTRAISAASSIAPRTAPSASWGRTNRRPRSISAELK